MKLKKGSKKKSDSKASLQTVHIADKPPTINDNENINLNSPTTLTDTSDYDTSTRSNSFSILSSILSEVQSNNSQSVPVTVMDPNEMIMPTLNSDYIEGASCNILASVEAGSISGKRMLAMKLKSNTGILYAASVTESSNCFCIVCSLLIGS